jgi:hypothetical protein
LTSSVCSSRIPTSRYVQTKRCARAALHAFAALGDTKQEATSFSGTYRAIDLIGK